MVEGWGGGGGGEGVRGGEESRKPPTRHTPHLSFPPLVSDAQGPYYVWWATEVMYRILYLG